MKDKEIVQELEQAKLSLAVAKDRMIKAKKELVASEDLVIELKVRVDNLTEALRQHNLEYPKAVLEQRELEIEGFKDRHPEWCSSNKNS